MIKLNGVRSDNSGTIGICLKSVQILCVKQRENKVQI